ncbi:MAG: efflux RND transporter permease subunit [Gemmatimonadales bacterium]
MTLAGLVLRQRVAVGLAALLLTLGGGYAATQLPAGIYPEAEFARIVVLANGGTFEPRDMVVAVTRPLEEALIGVIDLRRVRSRTVRGAAELNLDFRAGADMPFVLQQVQGRLASLQPDLPAGLQLTAERLTPSVFPMLQFELVGGDPVQLRDLAQYTIRPRLARLADVGNVEIQGGLVREVSVQLDPARLSANHIGAAEVADRLRDANTIIAAGRVDREYRQVGVLVTSLAATPEAVGNLVLRAQGGAPLRVRELGSVRYGTEDQFELASGNGEPAALINVSRQPDGSMLSVESAVMATVDSLRPLLPAGIRLEPVYNLGALVRESIASVRDAMLIGGVLAIITLLLFLGQAGMTAVAAVSLPLSLLGAFAGLALFGDSLNLMSLGGLAVAVGLIIDDAVVVIENIERRLAAYPGEAPAGVIETAVGEILAPVASSTITTVVVFLPLGLLSGVVGEFFHSFSLALAVAVLLSLVYAVTVIPALAGVVLERGRRVGAAHHAWFQLRLGGLQSWYAGVLRRMFARRWVVPAVTTAMLVLGGGLYQVLETGFLPDMDEGGFILDYWTPTGSSLAETDQQLHALERILKADDAIAAFTRRTGAELGLFATTPNSGDMTILLKPLGKRDASVYDVMDRLRVRIEGTMPALRVEFHQVQADLLGDLTGSPDPVELKLFHPDVRTAEVAAKTVAGAIEGTPGLEDLFDGVVGDLPGLTVTLDPGRVARLGLTATEVTAQARAALFGVEAGAIREPDRLVPIRVRMPDAIRYDREVLGRLPIVGPTGWAPLASLGTVTETAEVSELLRENLRPLVLVTGAVNAGSSSLGSVMGEIRARLAGVPLPAGTTLEYGGQEAGQRDSFHQLLLVFGLAAGAVLLVMVIQFGNLRGPLLILGGSVLGLSGALLGLVLAGIPFNVSSFMGLILLVGLVVKNGIILLDAARGLRESGLPVDEALIQAGQLRLRPILMTTVCTLTGLLPLALGIGAGADLQRPLAIAVIGGLSLSTLVTLFLLPVALRNLGGLGTQAHDWPSPEGTAVSP